MFKVKWTFFSLLVCFLLFITRLLLHVFIPPLFATYGSNAGLVWGEVGHRSVEFLNLDIELLDHDVEGLDILVVIGGLKGGLLQLVCQLVNFSLELASLLVNPKWRYETVSTSIIMLLLCTKCVAGLIL